MDEEIQNLKAENCKLKENAKFKPENISQRNLILKERASLMRERWKKIRDSTIFSPKKPIQIDHSSSNESHTAELESSFELLPDIHSTSTLPEQESSQLLLKSRKTGSTAVTSTNWSFSETFLI